MHSSFQSFYLYQYFQNYLAYSLHHNYCPFAGSVGFLPLNNKIVPLSLSQFCLIHWNTHAVSHCRKLGHQVSIIFLSFTQISPPPSLFVWFCVGLCVYVYLTSRKGTQPSISQHLQGRRKWWLSSSATVPTLMPSHMWVTASCVQEQSVQVCLCVRLCLRVCVCMCVCNTSAKEMSIFFT